MNWDRLIAITSMLLDAGILWILIVEYNYDKVAFEKQKYKRKKRTFEGDRLCIGEMQ